MAPAKHIMVSAKCPQQVAEYSAYWSAVLVYRSMPSVLERFVRQFSVASGVIGCLQVLQKAGLPDAQLMHLSTQVFQLQCAFERMALVKEYRCAHLE